MRGHVAPGESQSHIAAQTAADYRCDLFLQRPTAGRFKRQDEIDDELFDEIQKRKPIQAVGVGIARDLGMVEHLAVAVAGQIHRDYGEPLRCCGAGEIHALFGARAMPMDIDQ